jgi:superfamily I DNA/RNA helicase/RecB family exonuclease
MSPTYRLVAPDRQVRVPVLDEHQQRVVDHEGGPLLVLAGPGTGKTTTLVEAIVDRIENRGADPASVLALTFSRKAAEQLRDRVTARLGRTVASPLASTFHSFAYQLVRRYAPRDLYEGPLRLLSTPEQDVVLQELLTDAPESVSWPESLRRAVGTRGFSREVLDVLARAREKGLDPAHLVELGVSEGLAEYAAAGHFLEQYLTVLDNLGAIDYPDLLRRAVLEAGEHALDLQREFAHVFVDEYQDTDPSQVQLLHSIVGRGGNLTVVGDPHQSIYAFRGADVRGILEFPTAFPTADGSPAPAVVLRRTRRFGPHLLLAAQRVARRIPLPGAIPARARDDFLAPQADEGHGDGRVEVITFATERAEAEHVADLLRRAHLEDGVPWQDMAVLVRSGRATIPGLRRALAAAGVPVDVASDDTPLVREPAVEPLLAALRLVVHHEAGPQSPHHVDADAVQSLLGSPLAGLDVTDVRALARALRADERRTAEAEHRVPRPSAALVREAVLDPALLPDESAGTASATSLRRARAFAALIARAREVARDGGTTEQVLWALWSGSSWPDVLRSRARGGGAGARLAHRDLDAVMALFDAAGRSEDQRGHRSVESFLNTLTAQQIPGDSLAERGIRGESVRLLTAHRSKGLEWPLVVVAHVQEEAWPDLRRRASLLRADRIGADGLREPTTTREMLAEERRLFYVACTRARQRLVVTAVASQDDDGEQPSRFITELLPDHQRPRHESTRPRRPLSVAGIVAELRRTACDPDQPEALRTAAAARLRRLAGAVDGAGRPVAPGADPAAWWGMRTITHSDHPVRDGERPVALSASAVTEVTECPARWFLQREAGGAAVTSQAQGFGNIFHAIADGVAAGRLPASVADIDVLMDEVDRVWGQLAFRTPWSQERERDQLRLALVRFLHWHSRGEARALAGSEVSFHASATLPDGSEVVLRGRADRLEIDAEGRVVVVDLKTGKYVPTKAELVDHPQLGFYQYAVAHGGFAEQVGEGRLPGGAELWQVRHESRGELKVQHQPRQVPDDDGVTAIEHQLMDAVAVIRGERFEARPGKHCERCQFATMCPAQQSGTVLE